MKPNEHLVAGSEDSAVLPCIAISPPALASRKGREGLRRAWLHYAWRHVANQAAAIYAEVLQENRAPAGVKLSHL